ncbi:MAG: hypothetical protein AAGD01_18655 [Acidobacteriota bacterium]
MTEVKDQQPNAEGGEDPLADAPWTPEASEKEQLRRIAGASVEERVAWVEDMLLLAFEMGWAQPVRPVDAETWERWREHGRPPGDWRTAHDPWPSADHQDHYQAAPSRVEEDGR